MAIKHEIRKFLWNIGLDIQRVSHRSNPLVRRKKLFETYNVDKIIDVGANSGKWAIQLRRDLNYQGKIVSFEPLSSAFGLLESNSKDDQDWEIYNCALGDNEEKNEINISDNSHSSSILEMSPNHLNSSPDSHYVGKEKIEIKTLDSLFGKICNPAENIYMKIDTQGFESKVLKGAENSLSKIDTIQMEMSTLPMYDGELLFLDLCTLMDDKGYSLVSIETGFSDPNTGQLLQFDGIFHRF